jgi:hypothetical protein
MRKDFSGEEKTIEVRVAGIYSLRDCYLKHHACPVNSALMRSRN